MSDPIPNLENVTSELSYTELVGIFAPLYDLSTMLGYGAKDEQYNHAIVLKEFIETRILWTRVS